MVITVKDAVLHIWQVLKEQILNALTTKKETAITWGDEVLINPAVVIILRYLNVLNHPYTLNLHNVICQSYLNTLEDTEIQEKKGEDTQENIWRW